MKIIKGIILALTSFLLFSGCKGSARAADEYKLLAVVNAITDAELEVTVADNDGVHFGEYRILTSSATRYYAQDGVKIDRSAVEVGDTIEVTYNGQVMRSFPPQVVATSVTITAKGK